MVERTVWRVWHAGILVKEFDSLLVAQNVRRSKGLACHFPRRTEECALVRIEEVRIDDNGEEVED